MKIDRRFIDGASVFGVALTLFTIRNISGIATTTYWVLLISAIIFWLFSIRIFFGKKIE